METKYRDSDVMYELQASFAVEFDDTNKRISLNVPLEGVRLAGWKLRPLYNPLVRDFS